MSHCRKLSLGVACIGLVLAGNLGLHSLGAKDKLSREKPHHPKTMAHFGMCNASAGVFLNEHVFAAADDELNVIRSYRVDGAQPLQTLELSAFLGNLSKDGEADIEGAAQMGKRIYWISSHGRNKNGEAREARRRFFATDIVDGPEGPRLKLAGEVYKDLLLDLISSATLQQYDLAGASLLPPKTPGGLNIEGLASGPNGSLYIGFRNPTPHGRALVVPLLNPAELIEGRGQPKAKFGKGIEIDLNGEAIRDMLFHDGIYYILGGAYGGGGDTRLYEWDAVLNVATLKFDFAKGTFNPEAAIAVPGHPNQLLFLSDDGKRKTKGSICNDLPECERSFRSMLFTIPGR